MLKCDVCSKESKDDFPDGWRYQVVNGQYVTLCDKCRNKKLTTCPHCGGLIEK